eukprot:COSAG02_NODE_16568_length_1073_cov_21.632444_1_plen_189_part_00
MSAWTEGSNRKQIYVSGLPKDITEKELVEKFGQVGPIAKDPKRARFDPGAKKVWLYTDRATRKPKGDGTITYADEEAASAAVQFFHGQEMPGWDGQKLHVSIAQRKEGWDKGKRWAGVSCEQWPRRVAKRPTTHPRFARCAVFALRFLCRRRRWRWRRRRGWISASRRHGNPSRRAKSERTARGTHRR